MKNQIKYCYYKSINLIVVIFNINKTYFQLLNLKIDNAIAI